MRILLLTLIVCIVVASPGSCISRWFTATFNDLKFTLYRYGFCLNGLQPVTSTRSNETEYLVNQIKVFLDQGNYNNEQLLNVSALMDTVCRTGENLNYPISMHIDIASFNSSANPAAKSTRCRAIDDAMDSMYHVFRKAALNRSEALDFSSIKFYPDENDKSVSYNLSDLINTSWITSEAVYEHVCSITNTTKEYVLAKTKKQPATDREDPPAGLSSWFVWFFDRLLEPLLGLQKRLYWESTNRLEFVQTRLNSGLVSLRHGLGSLLVRANSTSVSKNVTESNRFTGTTARSTRVNSTQFVNATSGVVNLTTSAATTTTTTTTSTTTTTPLPTTRPVARALPLATTIGVAERDLPSTAITAVGN